MDLPDTTKNGTTKMSTGTTTTATASKHTDATLLPVPSKRITLERTSSIKRTSGFIVMYLSMETMKQMSNYGLSSSHGGKYPVPSTLIVLLTELTKLFIVLLYAGLTSTNISSWRPCLKLCAPAACYFCTNILYLITLPSTSPPIWMVLIQTRTLYTAFAYLVIFGREVGCIQLLGCVLVVGSLPVARISEIHAGHYTLTTAVLTTSQISAILSTVASLIVEMLLKNDKRNVVEQQAWLYVWGSILAGLSLSINTDLSTLTNIHLQWWSISYIMAAVGTSALAGLCVPFIVRNLDTIVKDYLAALNNTVLSVMTAILFPMSFTLNYLYILSLAILIIGIWLYEKNKIPICHNWTHF